MFARVRQPLLRLLRVPHDPDPPAGAPGSLRVFRAGRNYYKLRLVRWGLGQVGALIGIVVSLFFLAKVENAIGDVRTEVRNAIAAESEDPKAEPAREGEPQRRRAQARARRNRAEAIRQMADKSPGWVFPLLQLLEAGGIVLYLVQIPITYGLARLDYEMRWYMVTDRSLRIRAGLTTVLESTMSFANIQQVVVSQGPVQRLLGVADLHVQSAGGGGDEAKTAHGDSLHKGVFHGVDNAGEIRDLILERLREYREAGLGDPDDIPSHTSLPPATGETAPHAASTTMAAAREVLTEARALRQVLA